MPNDLLMPRATTGALWIMTTAQPAIHELLAGSRATVCLHREISSDARSQARCPFLVYVRYLGFDRT